ncbi:glycoside hydrolase family 3 C-terminal domain-containing protein [Nocardia shimofusensis]|uniref:glycoside hydrolase family 3 C-terminal domain-containing protein n=1 Tax=Nocardia shimofusensis TaxID=228596 RepID=UPI00082D7E34|nr:glycoside hydrolase family 3 C-terminal domain-containing protein [Nocardia shimofusensis]
MTDSPIADLSTADKAALGSGADFWTTKSVGEIESVTMTDGPHGVRRQVGATDHLGLSESLPATCFPPAVGLAQGWDAELVRRVAVALGHEARAAAVDVLLGPGVNIKRDPRGGRNFEYYSEDPLLTGVLGAAWVQGLQSTGVGASLKHFAANNAEHDRMRSSSDVDARPLREIYLRAFAHIVRTARPWTVMCSYNRINGVHACEDRWLLTEVLRGEWGFDGVVVSDWGAVTDRVRAVRAGLDLEMPGSGGASDARVVSAVEAGVLDPADLDRAAERMAVLAERVRQGRQLHVPEVDVAAHHALAREVAGRCVVLLKNDRELLPLSAGSALAVVGEFAESPRYQGGGSSHVNAARLDVPLEEIRAHAGPGSVTYARGFTTDGTGDADALRVEAVAVASEAAVAVVFLGLAANQESEGFDRTDIELPADQLRLLTEVVRVQPRTVVVLAHGGMLRLEPVAAQAQAILDGGLLGQAGGGGLADVLFGVVNPSGRLAETAPRRLQDTPAFLNFPGEHSRVRYGEGLFVGYRWYDAREMEVCFPFGHGLSYTSFDYSELTVDSDAVGWVVEVTVTNTGSWDGREVVQVYVGLPGSSVVRPVRVLAGFATVDVAAGTSVRVAVPIRREDLAYWDPRLDRWVVEGGEYEVFVGASSRDLRGRARVPVAGDEVRVPVTLDSTLGEALADPKAAEALGKVAAGMGAMLGGGSALGVDLLRMLESIPLRRLANFGVDAEELDRLLAES